MPSTSAKQARFMAAAAHDAKFAKKAGIPQGVAREFNEADAAKRAARPGGYPSKSNHPRSGGYR
jgi:hypothetical protein